MRRSNGTGRETEEGERRKVRGIEGGRGREDVR